jgi:acyl-[acyl-carrier-protein]-phospholipid O-acyltransferase / long-chain-fatty-acid--[acyl-carrier-protein] ligase
LRSFFLRIALVLSFFTAPVHAGCGLRLLDEGWIVAPAEMFFRTTLPFRYKIRLHGINEIAKRGDQRIIFLANHPTEIIGPLVDYLMLRKAGMTPRAWIHETQVGGYISQELIRQTHMIVVPDIGSEDRRIRRAAIEKYRSVVIPENIDYLKRGGNILIYPAGELARSNREIVRFCPTNHLLPHVPGARVVLMRSRGWWGSDFSLAPTGKWPDKGKFLARDIMGAATSFGFRRHPIDITFKEVEDFPLDPVAAKALVEAFFNDQPEQNTYWPRFLFEAAGPQIRSEPVIDRFEFAP